MGSSGSKMGTCETYETTFDRWVGTKLNPIIKNKTTVHTQQTRKSNCSGIWSK